MLCSFEELYLYCQRIHTSPGRASRRIDARTDAPVFPSDGASDAFAKAWQAHGRSFRNGPTKVMVPICRLSMVSPFFAHRLI